MKFGKLYYKARHKYSIGDTLQLLAIDYIYEKAGIQKNDIVIIDKNELMSYNGEYVILPINMPLIDYVPNGLAGRFSPKIIPLFLGLILYRDYLYPEEVVYLRQYEPIGCRDERTFRTIRRYGIISYLHGCITAVFPKRDSNALTHEKVYLVETPHNLEAYIPDNIMKYAIRVTHTKDYIPDNPEQEALKQYEMYKNNAKLVITSLMHCAVPCMAAGIPVILANEHCSFRYGWLEKLLPIYLPEDFSSIDWYPNEVNYEPLKEQLIRNAVRHINCLYEKFNEIYTISSFYEGRVKKDYAIDWFKAIKEKIESTWNKEVPVKYAVWGLSQITEITVSYIKQHYPNAHLEAVYDRYRTMEFEGIMSQNPENLAGNSDLFTIVSEPNAIDDAKELFDRIHKNEATYILAGN